MLGHTGNHSALPALLGELKSKNEKVKIAAIQAAGNTGGAEALPALLNTMKTADAKEVHAISQTILGMKGTDITRQVGNAITTTPSPTATGGIDPDTFRTLSLRPALRRDAPAEEPGYGRSACGIRIPEEYGGSREPADPVQSFIEQFRTRSGEGGAGGDHIRFFRYKE